MFDVLSTIFGGLTTQCDNQSLHIFYGDYGTWYHTNGRRVYCVPYDVYLECVPGMILLLVLHTNSRSFREACVFKIQVRVNGRTRRRGFDFSDFRQPQQAAGRTLLRTRKYVDSIHARVQSRVFKIPQYIIRVHRSTETKVLS